jgi:hypothetical protein
MALSGKQHYTQADGALTTAWQDVTFSEDGTNRIYPNGIIIKNTDTSGSNLVHYAINGELENGTIAKGKGIRYSIKKVKTLKLKYTTGAPNFDVQAVR